ncbi:MAG TPA: J domain-containing protein [Xanthobacteraceae bacterium]|nr:J domain-containing protein [Xanthobacteraceae bacterium]
MKLDSPLFDGVRVKPDQDRRLRATCPACEWPGCEEAATHRAPKGRLREGQYWRFCLEHVRSYNQSYNFFAGMSEEAVAEFQKDALTGHRPTWKMGVNGYALRASAAEGNQFGVNFAQFGAAADPIGLFRELGGRAGWQPPPHPPEREGRMIRNAERKAFDTLGLELDATREGIRARFKELVKRHHPDANGGDRGAEDRLREVIQAYKYLKNAGFC